MGNFFVNLKIVRSNNFFTYRSGSKNDCDSKSEKTSSSNSINKLGEMSSVGASGSRKLKRKVDEISSNKSSRLEVDQNTSKVPKLAPAKLLSSKTDSNLKGKDSVKGKKTNILNFAALINS